MFGDTNHMSADDLFAWLDGNKGVKHNTYVKYNTYLIVFNDFCEDEIRLRIKQDINRPNNPDDDDLIREYILNNYGHTGYTSIEIGNVKLIDI